MEGRDVVGNVWRWQLSHPAPGTRVWQAGQQTATGRCPVIVRLAAGTRFDGQEQLQLFQCRITIPVSIVMETFMISWDSFVNQFRHNGNFLSSSPMLSSHFSFPNTSHKNRVEKSVTGKSARGVISICVTGDLCIVSCLSGTMRLTDFGRAVLLKTRKESSALMTSLTVRDVTWRSVTTREVVSTGLSKRFKF